MRFEETVRTSLIALNANKVRSFLTMLGVVIGVFSVVTMVALGRGVSNFITDQFNDIGSNLIFLSPGKVDLQDDPAKSFSRNKLDEKHLKLIDTYAGDYVVAATPSIRVGETVKYKNKSFFTTVAGNSEKSPEIFNLVLDKGRYFNKAEVKSKAKVAVIGSEIKKELFKSDNPIGKRIKAGEESFEVIAVLEPKNSDFDELMMSPYTAVMDVFGVKNFSGIAMKAKDNESVDVAIRNVELALLRDLKEDDFTVFSQQEILGSINDILQILTAGLGAIAGISLIVGGIGIMNIMLVSVTERIREIGLRKAVGASSFNIGVQFLVESTLLSVGGGTIGLLLGFMGTLVARQFIRAEIPLYGVVMAFGFSVFVGVVFGTYPALQASKKDPIDALRYE